MRIYLAGWHGNLCPLFSKMGGAEMRVFLGGEHPVKNGRQVKWKGNRGVNLLESYYYARGNKFIPKLLPELARGRFMLDSGAYSFMVDKTISLKWEDYVREYAEFINRFDVQYFFELDIDNVIGLKKVEGLRNLLSRETGKTPIPVWHKSRGKEYFKDMCKEYDYVSIGGIVSQEIKRTEFRHFPWFIDTAHKHNSKIHGLGVSGLTDLLKYNFDSVDSTAWLYGNRGGFVYFFDGKTLTKKKVGQGQQLKSQQTALHNFQEWVKFSNYLENRGR